MDSVRKEGEEEMGRTEGGETVFRIYCVWEKNLFLVKWEKVKQNKNNNYLKACAILEWQIIKFKLFFFVKHYFIKQ